MIVRARAPLRLGLAGGGTDVSPYCDEFGGSVLNATIDLYAYAMLEPLAEAVVEFVAPDLDRTWTGKAAFPLETNGPLGLHAAVYNRIIRDFHGEKPLGVRLTTFADAPPGSGLGSSSTLIVAMIKAFQELLNLPLGEYETAHLAFEIERIDMGLSGGKQDQYAATFGGFNFMEFYAGERVIVNPLRVKNWILSELEASMLLYFTGVSRLSSTIIEQQRTRVQQRLEAQLAAMHSLKEEAAAMKEAVLKGDMAKIADCMRRSWESKKLTAEGITNAPINGVFETALAAGAKAGKVSGAGGGGFIMLIVDPPRRMEVRRALLAKGGQVFNCHFTKHGTQGWRV
ncbi:MAG: hypothetical protein ACKVP3_08645 [Hyphomicrobiaceae bacterium]